MKIKVEWGVARERRRRESILSVPDEAAELLLHGDMFDDEVFEEEQKLRERLVRLARGRSVEIYQVLEV